jgi:hypothetical protein
MTDTRFKVENGLLAIGASGNSLFEHQVSMNANLTVNADLMLVKGNFTVQGTTTYVGDLNYAVDLVPTTNATLKIGTPTNTYLGHFYNLTIYNSLVPSANGKAFGNTISRWDTYSTAISASGNVTVNSTAFVVDAANMKASVNASIGSATLTVGGTANVSGNVNVSGSYVNVAGNVTAAAVLFGYAAIFTNTATVSTTSSTRIDSFAKTVGKAAKLLIHIDPGNTTQHALEMLLVHDGTNVLTTKYGYVYNTSLGTIDSVILGANVDINFTAAAAGTYTVKTIRQQML